MASPFLRYITIYTIIIFIILFLFFYPLHESVVKMIQQYGTIESGKLRLSFRQMIVNRKDNNQFFVSTYESPFVRLYLDVVRDTICGLTLQTQEKSVKPGIKILKLPFQLALRIAGEDWPLIGITMIGQKRLINLEWAIRYAFAHGIPGDFVECGVWRGGASIFARAVFKALDITDRHVWVVDSFQGLPKARTANDVNSWSEQTYLRVSLEEVQTNFRSFNLLDEQVHFCKGYFVDSLPRCNVTQIAVLRMDGDMYESTMDQLFNLYAKVPVGGVIIVDDYNIPECIKAINDFREWHGMSEEIKTIPGDRFGSYWIKNKTVTLQMNRYKPLLAKSKK